MFLYGKNSVFALYLNLFRKKDSIIIIIIIFQQYLLNINENSLIFFYNEIVSLYLPCIRLVDLMKHLVNTHYKCKYNYLLLKKTIGYLIYFPHLYTSNFTNNKLKLLNLLVSNLRFACLKTTEQRSIRTKIKFFQI